MRGDLAEPSKAPQKTWPQRNGSVDHEQAGAGHVPGDLLPSMPCGPETGRGSIRGDLSGGVVGSWTGSVKSFCWPFVFRC